ncbi:MAG: sigma-54 dependent transcriptional regulator [Pseudomonadota bacterium]
MSRILVVDDEKSMRDFFDILLRREEHEVQTAASGEEALELIARQAFDLVITDLKMPRVTGLDVLGGVKKYSSDTEVIVITAYSAVETAIEAMRLGAFNYLSKPFHNEEIKLVIEKALEKRRLVVENQRLHEAVLHGEPFQRIIGRSGPIREIFRQVRQIAPTRSTVLITGESGTGKEMVARAVHHASPRTGGAFAVMNCGAIPHDLMESEVFGHVKGAFTGAGSDKKGMAEVAQGGTFFMDEIGELPPLMQVKLLRLLQEKRLKPVGGTREVEVDLRIIAATNRNLEDEVAAGRFREDLYFRLNVIQLHVPPLRERREDIPLLAQHFLRKYASELGREIRGFSKEALHVMMTYGFPGTVRELENLVERSVAFEVGEWISVESLPPKILRTYNEGEASLVQAEQHEGLGPDFSLDQYIERIERHHVSEALRTAGGSVTRAAERLGLSFRSMRYKMAKYGVKK